MIFKYIIIAIIGLIESFGGSINMKFLQRSKKLFCFITAFFNILLWYFIISMIIEDIANIWLIFVYATSYAFGDVLAITFDQKLEKIAKTYSVKRKRKKKLKKRSRKK